MKVGELEARIWELEGIRVCVLAPSHEDVYDYNFRDPARESWQVAEWLKARVQPSVPDRVVMVLRGDGQPTPGSVRLQALRHTY